MPKITTMLQYNVTFLLHLKILPRKMMLLNSCDGLKTRCLAIASPSDVAKRQEAQANFTPLGGGREK